jgi:peptidyl-prolyl cis-trans isomerase D
MLQSMRNVAHSWPVKLMLSLLIVSFGIWGIGDMFRGNPQQKAVATVGSQKIAVLELEQRFQRDMPEARRVYGPELTSAQARQIGLLDRALDVLIKYSTVNQEIKRLGINIPDRMIVEDLAKQEAFKGKDGKFDPVLWHTMIGKNGLTERLFIDDQKQNAARRLLLGAVVSSAPPPALVIDTVYEAYGAKKIIEILSLANDKAEGVAKPTETELKNFYDANGDHFRAPEYRTLTVAVLTAADAGKDYAPTDEDVRKAYDERSADLAQPEKRDLVQVVLQDEAKAKALAEAAEKTGNLTEAAKAKGLNAVPLKNMDEHAILPELYTTAFAMEEGQISPPVKSSLGWHVMQVKAIHAAGTPAFDAIKDELIETLKAERASDIVARNVNQLDDSLAANKPLEDIADALKLRLIKLPRVDQAGQADGQAKLEPVPARDDVLKAAFGLNAGEASQVIEDKNGNYVVVRVDDVTPSQVRPFEQVKDQVAHEVLAAKQAERAAAKAEEIAKAVRDGKKLSTFASLPGVDIRLSKPISVLGERDPALPVEALPDVLKMKLGDVVTFRDKDRQLVLRLADIHPVDIAKPGPERLKVQEKLRDALEVEIAEQYETFLHRRTPVKINADLLETLKKQGS